MPVKPVVFEKVKSVCKFATGQVLFRTLLPIAAGILAINTCRASVPDTCASPAAPIQGEQALHTLPPSVKRGAELGHLVDSLSTHIADSLNRVPTDGPEFERLLQEAVKKKLAPEVQAQMRQDAALKEAQEKLDWASQRRTQSILPQLRSDFQLGAISSEGVRFICFAPHVSSALPLDPGSVWRLVLSGQASAIGAEGDLAASSSSIVQYIFKAGVCNLSNLSQYSGNLDYTRVLLGFGRRQANGPADSARQGGSFFLYDLAYSEGPITLSLAGSVEPRRGRTALETSHLNSFVVYYLPSRPTFWLGVVLGYEYAHNPVPFGGLAAPHYSVSYAGAKARYDLGWASLPHVAADAAFSTSHLSEYAHASLSFGLGYGWTLNLSYAKNGLAGLRLEETSFGLQKNW